MPSVLQTSFSRGEVATDLFGRTDTAAYQVALKTAWNVVIHAYGGASNRPGLEFIGPTKTHTNTARLIPFRFKGSDTYMLEFGDLYMRVIRGDAHVVETAVAITAATKANPVAVTAASHGYANGDDVIISGVTGMTELNGRYFRVSNKTANTFDLTDQATGVGVDGSAYATYVSGGTVAKLFEIATPYAVADLAALKYAQQTDQMRLAHPSYAPQVLTRTDHDAWTMADIVFHPDQADPITLAGTQNGTPASTEYRYQVTAVGDQTFEESLPGLNATTKTITGATAANPVVVTATAHGFLDGERVEINGIVGMTELNARRFTVANKTANTFELSGEDGSGHTAYASAGTANLTFIKITNGAAALTTANNISLSWAAAVDAQRYVVYRYDNGVYGFLGETEIASYVDAGAATPDLTSSPPRANEFFIGADDKPGAIGFYEQRLILGGSNNNPDTTDYSRVATFNNFTASIPGQADDAIRATLTSGEVNGIRHYVALDHLLIFTEGEEWRIDPGDNNRFSADTIRQKPQSRWGSSHSRPVVVGRVVLFVQENNAVIRSIGYTLAVDGYDGTNLSLLSNHLFRDHTIVDAAYAKTPDTLSYYVRSDGRVATMTFDQEQEVVAWTRWGTRSPDKFERVAVVRPSDILTDDAAYFVVKRTMSDGTVRRYIERTHTRKFTDVRDCFFVDSGLSYDNPIAITAASLTSPATVTVASGHGLSVGDEVDVSDIVWVPDVDLFDTETQPQQLNGRFRVRSVDATTISLETLAGAAVDATSFNAYVEGGNIRKAISTLTGFHHIAGESAVALADGSVVRNLTISSTGQVTLPRKASRVHVGLGYYSDVELLDIVVPDSTRTVGAQGLLKNVHKVLVRLDRSRGLWVGPNAAELTELKQRQAELYGEPTRLFSGLVEIPIFPEWNSGGGITFRQRDPLPMTILAALPQFETEEAESD